MNLGTYGWSRPCIAAMLHLDHTYIFSFTFRARPKRVRSLSRVRTLPEADPQSRGNECPEKSATDLFSFPRKKKFERNKKRRGEGQERSGEIKWVTPSLSSEHTNENKTSSTRMKERNDESLYIVPMRKYIFARQFCISSYVAAHNELANRSRTPPYWWKLSPKTWTSIKMCAFLCHLLSLSTAGFGNMSSLLAVNRV